jgi:hypothetical protein
MTQDPLKHLSAIRALVDTAQRHASKLALACNPDSLPAAAAVALQHALECAQVQAFTLTRLLAAPPRPQGQAPDKERTTACLPEPPELG